MFNFPELPKLSAVGVPSGGVPEFWYRCFSTRFLSKPLNTSHTKTAVTRYNAGHRNPIADQFETLYMCDDRQTALYEINALLGSPTGYYLNNPNISPIATLTFKVMLQSVLDLSNEKQVEKIDGDVQYITGDWDAYSRRNPFNGNPAPGHSVHGWTPISPTQLLGKEIHDLPEVEGFVSVSAKVPTRKVLIIFTDKLMPGSYVECHDDRKLIQRIP